MDLFRDRPQRLRSEAGATLVEVLVALSILSIAAVAILAGVEMSIRTSDIHRKQSAGGAFVRNYAEAIQDYVAEGNYDTCDGGVDYAPGTVGYDVPDGYEPGIQDVVALTGNGVVVGCDADAGVQRLTVTMESSDHRASEELTIVLRNPCAPGGPAC